MSESDESAPVLEEPQEERGEPGARDEGGAPGAGPSGREAGDPHSGDHTTIDSQQTSQDDVK
ncbi:MAG: hypothetical protein ABI912_00760 [Actinomycetota bacterium]